MQAPRILLSARRCLVKTWSWPWLTRSFTDGLGTLGNLPIKVCGPGLPHAEMSRFWTYSMESPYWAPCKYPIGTRLTGNSDPVPICVPFTPIHRRWLKKNGGYRFVQSIVKYLKRSLYEPPINISLRFSRKSMPSSKIWRIYKDLSNILKKS